MTAGNQLLTARPAWRALEAHHQKIRVLHLRKLFADDTQRGELSPSERRNDHDTTNSGLCW